MKRRAGRGSRAAASSLSSSESTRFSKWRFGKQSGNAPANQRAELGVGARARAGRDGGAGRRLPPGPGRGREGLRAAGGPGRVAGSVGVRLSGGERGLPRCSDGRQGACELPVAPGSSREKMTVLGRRGTGGGWR